MPLSTAKIEGRSRKYGRGTQTWEYLHKAPEWLVTFSQWRCHSQSAAFEPHPGHYKSGERQETTPWGAAHHPLKYQANNGKWRLLYEWTDFVRLWGWSSLDLPNLVSEALPSPDSLNQTRKHFPLSRSQHQTSQHPKNHFSKPKRFSVFSTVAPKVSKVVTVSSIATSTAPTGATLRRARTHLRWEVGRSSIAYHH